MGPHWAFGRGGGHEQVKGTFKKPVVAWECCGMEGQATHKSQGLPTPQFLQGGAY